MFHKLYIIVVVIFYLQLYINPIFLNVVKFEQRSSKKCGHGSIIKDSSGNINCLCYSGWGGKYCTSCMGILRVRLHKGNLSSGYNDGSLSYRSCVWLFEGLPKYSYITLHVVAFSIACQLSNLDLQSSSSPFDTPLASISGKLSNKSVVGSFQADASGRAVLFYQESEALMLFNKQHFTLTYEFSVCPWNCSGHGYCIASRRLCNCLPGWKGLGCQLSYEMTSIDLVYSQILYLNVDNGITSHVMLKFNQGNKFILVGGTDLSLNDKSNDILRIAQFELTDVNNDNNFKDTQFLVKWKGVIKNSRTENYPPCLFEHSAIIINDTLWVIGGRFCGSHKLSDNIWYVPLDKLSQNKTWRQHRLPLEIGGISGHITASRKTFFSSQLLILFGYSSKLGWMLSHRLLTLNILNLTWEWSTTRGSIPPRRYGVAAAQWKDNLRIHGGWGFSQRQQVFMADTYNLQLDNLIWNELHPTGRPQALHSMIHSSDDSGQFLLLGGYHCNGECLVESVILWAPNGTKEAQMPRGVARFGAAAFSLDNNFRRILIHGGFRSSVSADLFLLDTTNATWQVVNVNCSWWTSCQACQNANCSWNDADGNCQIGNQRWNTCLKSSYVSCFQFKTCVICQEAGCMWHRLNSGKSICKRLETKSGGIESVSSCESCYVNKDCFSCLSFTTDECVWCPLQQFCLSSSVAAGAFSHYGECNLRLNRPGKQSLISNTCQRHNCSQYSSCEDCTRQALCGWCSSITGLGNCLPGGVFGPIDNFHQMRRNSCFGSGTTWSYGRCPQCQCYGHGQCAHGLSSCSCDPRTLTTGRNCEYCVAGAYFNGSGSPNDGTGRPCVECPCQGRASFCDSPYGNCEPYCLTPGTIGLYCHRCSSIQRHGLPVFQQLDDRCYQLLRVNYKLEVGGSDFDLGHIKRFNFLARPLYYNRDLRIEVECSRGTAILDLLYVTELSDMTRSITGSGGVVSRGQLCSHETRWRVTLRAQQAGDYDFARHPNLTFLIHVFFNSSIELGVIIVQEPTLNLAKFFIIFISCFMVLLTLAAIFWKAKQYYDQFRRAQRHKVKEQRMAARPRALTHLLLDGLPPRNDSFYKSFLSLQPLTKTPQHCSSSTADLVITCVMRLPGPIPLLCLGSALVHTGPSAADGFDIGLTTTANALSLMNCKPM